MTKLLSAALIALSLSGCTLGTAVAISTIASGIVSVIQAPDSIKTLRHTLAPRKGAP